MANSAKRDYMKQQTNKNYLLVLIPIAVCLLIFHNSMDPIVKSDVQSGFVLRVLNHILAHFGCHHELTQFTVRKLAHFTEYFIFGFALTAILPALGRDGKPAPFLGLFVFLLVPLFDETIQLGSSGRNSSVLDVWLDFAGCVAAMALCSLIRCLINRCRKRV